MKKPAAKNDAQWTRVRMPVSPTVALQIFDGGNPPRVGAAARLRAQASQTM